MRVPIYDMRLDKETGRSTPNKIKEVNYPKLKRINNPKAVQRLCNDILSTDQLADEMTYVLAFNNSKRLLGVFEIGHGGANYCLVGIRETFSKLISIGAVAFILVHNHPTGDVAPSKADLELFENMYKTGEFLSVKLLDCIIIGGGTTTESFCYSALESGALPVK